MFKGKILNHKNIYIAAMLALAASLPLWPLLMSISMLTLLGNWILEGNFKSKFRIFFSNRIALVLSSLFLLHLIGLLYTSDFNYALKDLRVKSPILALPLIISTTIPFNRKLFLWILNVFVLSVFIATMADFSVFVSGKYHDIRDISIFISHIRFSLMICLSFFICMYWFFTKKDLLIGNRFVYLFIALWLVIFTFILETFTGISILFLILLFYLVKFVFTEKKIWIKLISLIVIIAIPAFAVYNIKSVYNILYCGQVVQEIDYSKVTAIGNKYLHRPLDKQTENCNYVMRYVSEFEMSEAWNKRSKIKFNQKDQKGQYIQYTLMRFLTSKGYYKDAEGVNKLTVQEVECIENGVANCNLAHLKGFKSRIYEILWEFKNYFETGDPNAHSLMLRFIYWDASVGIIKNNLLYGVGTGDMNIAFEEQYKKMETHLDKEYRLRSHNQYLSIAVGFGIIGLIWFLTVLLYPFLKYRKWKDFYYLTFIIVFLLSMVTEDTIESQPGVFFYAFFTSLFLLGMDNFAKKTE